MIRLAERRRLLRGGLRYEEEIQPAIIIEVDKSDPGTVGFDDVLLGRLVSETKCIPSASAAISLNFARKGLPEAALLEAGWHCGSPPLCENANGDPSNRNHAEP